MDDEPDRAYSRAPELQDLVDLCRAPPQPPACSDTETLMRSRYAGAGSTVTDRAHSVR